jgi:YggT family protein
VAVGRTAGFLFGANLVLTSILSLIVNTVASFLGGILLLRFWMQAVRVRPPSSLAQFTFELTDWLVKPLRRVVAGFGGYDWASLIGAVIVVSLLGTIEAWISGSFWWPLIVKLSISFFLQWIFYGLIGLILIGVVFSWINPYAPMAPFIFALGDPILRPLRRIIPPIGNVDLSPLVALLALQILLWLALGLVGTLIPMIA